MRRAEAVRLRTLADALEVPSASDPAALLAATARTVAEGGGAAAWLALAVLRAELPTIDDVIAVVRRLRLEEPAAVLTDLVTHPAKLGPFGVDGVPTVRVIHDAVVVDVHHTARTSLATGIQRVVRRTIEQWDRGHELVLAGWSSDYRAMRELSAPERENALHGTKPGATRPRLREVAVPWRCTYLLPELATERERTSRIAALAEYSGNRTGVVGHDCVPLTSAETVGPGMGAAFAKNLVAVARMDKVAATSVASTTEYVGWRRMLAGAGLQGPDIREIGLPREAGDVTQEQLDAAAGVLLTGDLPLVLCVGSHEPRKNHLAVLQAAEQLWRSGRDFSLVFIGGNSWASQDFELRVAQLQADGHPVRTIAAVTDDVLWSAYRLAACTVFPSLNEGYGLPVAESLAVGTPVVTSDFGSMEEIAAEGGAVLVSPRDDDGIARAIESTVFDEDSRARLLTEAGHVTPRSWADYAGELWDYLVTADPVPAE